MGGRGTRGATRANGATGVAADKTVSYGGYTWDRHPNALRGSKVLLIDADKFDANWSKSRDAGEYIGKGESGIGGRRENVESFLKTGKPIHASKVGIDKNGNVYIEDGRHRFAVLRDKGVKKIGVTVSKKDYKKMKERFGG